MIISPRHFTVIAHIPKNGGTTLQKAFKSIQSEHNGEWLILSPKLKLSSRSGEIKLIRMKKGEALSLALPESFVDINCLNNEKQYSLSKHSTFNDLRMFLSETSYASLRQLIISRNPYSRAFSSWNFLLSLASSNQRVLKKLETLYGSSKPSFYQFYQHNKWQQFLACHPQHIWLDTLRKPDYIIKLEESSEKLVTALKDLGFESRTADHILHYIRNNRNNSSTMKESWRTLLSSSDLELVRSIYSEDFSVFGYSL
jgi:hypothetical protein